MESSESVWTRVEGVLETEIGNDISLYDPKEERVTVLNTTASDIWRLLDGATTQREITQLLARSYATDPAGIEDDVANALTQLAEQSLVEAIR